MKYRLLSFIAWYLPPVVWRYTPARWTRWWAGEWIRQYMARKVVGS